VALFASCLPTRDLQGSWWSARDWPRPPVGAPPVGHV